MNYYRRIKLKITDKNGIVKWEDVCGVPIGIGMWCGDENGWKCQACEESEIPDIPMDLEITKLEPKLPKRVVTLPPHLCKSKNWFRVRGKWFHVVKADDGCCYVNGKLFPEPTPYNERMKSIGWDFYEEVLFVLEGEERANDVQIIERMHLNLAKNINLLPKESTMKTRYAVVNLREKVEFEKKWEMPYGYNNCPHISFNQREAIGWVNQNLGPNERKDYVVERHTGGKVEIVWKIVAGVTPKMEDFDDEEF